jgi:hypothetical protein
MQGNVDADAVAREGLSSPFLSPNQQIQSCVGRLKVKECLKERHCEHWATAPDVRQLKLFVGRLDKLSSNLITLDRKQCRLVTGLLTGHLH